MIKNKNNKVTLEDLANMVAKGFDGVDKRFDGVDKRFDRIEHDLTDVKQRLGKVEFQVDEVYDILKRFEEHDILNLQKRVHVLEKAVRALAGQMTK